MGLSQRQLALLLGVAGLTIGLWERGQRRIIWPGILSLALEAIEARFAADGMLFSRSPAPCRWRSSGRGWRRSHHLRASRR